MSQPPKSTILAPSRRWASFRTVFCVISIPCVKVLSLFSETKKGQTRTRCTKFTPLSLIPERLPFRISYIRSRCPIGGRPRCSATLQRSLHIRSFCLSVSGWIAPSAAGSIYRSLPFAGVTITRGRPYLQAEMCACKRRIPCVRGVVRQTRL